MSDRIGIRVGVTHTREPRDVATVERSQLPNLAKVRTGAAQALALVEQRFEALQLCGDFARVRIHGVVPW